MSTLTWVGSSACNKHQASCTCLRPKGHDGPHVCSCGGAWAYPPEGFRYYRAPVAEGMLTSDTVESYAAKVPTEPANPLYDMWLALGGEEDDDA